MSTILLSSIYLSIFFYILSSTYCLLHIVFYLPVYCSLSTCLLSSIVLPQALLVDDDNKILMCLHAKVGCSSWKWILVNNTASDPDKIPWNREVHNLIWKYNISRVTDRKYSDDEIRYRLDNYYKVLVVRHPYDR